MKEIELARKIVYENYLMRGAFKELAEMKTKENEHLVELIAEALTQAEKDGYKRGIEDAAKVLECVCKDCADSIRGLLK